MIHVFMTPIIYNIIQFVFQTGKFTHTFFPFLNMFNVLLKLGEKDARRCFETQKHYITKTPRDKWK